MNVRRLAQLFDLNRDGYFDLVFCNAQEHWEQPPAYVYSDYCSGTLWAFDLTSGRNEVLVEGLDAVSAVRTGPDAELYVLQRSGTVSKLVQG